MNYNTAGAYQLQKLKQAVRFFPLQLFLNEIILKHGIGFYNQHPDAYKDDLRKFNEKFKDYIYEEIQISKSDCLWISTFVFIGITFFVGLIILSIIRKKPLTNELNFISGFSITIFAITMSYFLYNFFKMKKLQRALKNASLPLTPELPPDKILSKSFEYLMPVFHEYGLSKFLQGIRENISHLV